MAYERERESTVGLLAGVRLYGRAYLSLRWCGHGVETGERTTTQRCGASARCPLFAPPCPHAFPYLFFSCVTSSATQSAKGLFFISGGGINPTTTCATYVRGIDPTPTYAMLRRDGTSASTACRTCVRGIDCATTSFSSACTWFMVGSNVWNLYTWKRLDFYVTAVREQVVLV